MRASILVFSGALCFLAPQLINAQCLVDSRPPTRSSKARLTIKIDDVTDLGRPVLAEFSLVNTSKEAISMAKTFVERDYEVHAFDATGAELPLTPYGKRIRTPPIVDFRVIEEILEPGGTATASEDVSRVYDFSRPGAYSLVACRETQETGPLSSDRVLFQLK